MTRPTTIRLAIFLAVVVSIWTALVYGVSPDDPDLDDSGVDGAELLARELGATVVEEIPHD